jgi:hypothetical protein
MPEQANDGGELACRLVLGVALAASPAATPERFAYGSAPSQFGELWLLQQNTKAPIDALIGTQRRRTTAYADTSPRALLPLGVRQPSVSGDEDGIVPAPFGRAYAAAAVAAGDRAVVIELAGADHFALIAPLLAVSVAVREPLLSWLFNRK